MADCCLGTLHGARFLVIIHIGIIIVLLIILDVFTAGRSRKFIGKTVLKLHLDVVPHLTHPSSSLSSVVALCCDSSLRNVTPPEPTSSSSSMGAPKARDNPLPNVVVVVDADEDEEEDDDDEDDAAAAASASVDGADRNLSELSLSMLEVLLSILDSMDGRTINSLPRQ